ncbi:RidA family protein [Virgibacillus sp. NKC19-3]|uniref:RidA family protein n=1 Tax=Virgibacillus saliphilus TaxID=2831674 RepID=UPI001C9B2045|nr:RidA family protein [Virgibacillus sp. NKC19-3]MBY7141762.1 RidA family protein [Virgibacillus sp. NKC19-3]
MGQIESKMKELGIDLSEVPKPAANYIPAQQTGNLVYTSGQDCRREGTLMHEGKLGQDLTIEQGQEAARQSAINCLAVLKFHLGDLDRVTKIVKVLSFVNSSDGFVEQPYVVNGASDLLEEVFGEKGEHARSAISANELPFNTPVETELIVEVD